MKTAVITGASGAIGRELVKKFVKDGYIVIGQVNDNLSRAEKLKNELAAEGYSDCFFPFKADFTVAEQTEDFCNFVNENFRHVGVLVNNAGVDVYKLFTDTTEQDFDNVFSVNVKSAFSVTKSVLGGMIAKGEGTVIFVSSVWGVAAAPMEAIYSASKSALIGMAKSLAKEVAPSGVRVNCICPGVIDTPMNDRFSEEERRDIVASIPLGRTGTAKEVADVIAFLASDAAQYITGAVITADGGFTL